MLEPASKPEYFQGCLLTYKFFFGKTYNPGYQILVFRFERLQPYRLVPNLRNTRILGYNKYWGSKSGVKANRRYSQIAQKFTNGLT